MFKLDVMNLPEVRAEIMRLASNHVPNATCRALNDTAYDALDEVKKEMLSVFDRPTRFTLNALYVWRATVQNPVATIEEKNMVVGKHYLKVQQAGGVRPSTGLEGLLRSKVGNSSYIAAVAPAYGAKLDANGNWSAAERNQALSGIKAQRDERTNTTNRSRKLSRNKSRAVYFVPQEGSRLGPGIYRRNGKAAPVKILNFLDARPKYEKRIDYRDVVERTAKAVYEAHFEKRLNLLLK